MTPLTTPAHGHARRGFLLALFLAVAALLPVGALAAPGNLDTGFNAQLAGSPFAWVDDAAAQADGQIVIGGIFISAGGQTRNRIARVDATTGALDAAFNPNANERVRAVALQADGKIVIGGDFTSIGGTTINRIARLNADGSLDTSFRTNVGTGANAGVYDIVIQPDGDILIGGSFTTVDGHASSKVARLDPDGNADTGFAQTATTSGTVYRLAREADGKVLAGGPINATVAGPTTLYGLFRIDTSGVIDPSFAVNLASGSQVDAVAVQADGKILVGGAIAFDPLGVNRRYFLRLNADATLDSAFAPNANEAATAIHPQADGSILIGGLFTSVGGETYGRVARLLGTGAVDTTFADPNANSRSNIIIPQSDGGTLIGGNFTTVGGVSRPGLARLMGPEVQVAATPASASIIYGDATPAIGFTATGFAAGDDWVTPPACGIFTQASPPAQVTATPLPVGTYDISCSGGDPGPGYSVSYTSGTLTVSAVPSPDPVPSPGPSPAPTPSPAAPSITIPVARAVAGRVVVLRTDVSAGGTVSVRGTRGSALACAGSRKATAAGSVAVTCRMTAATTRVLRSRSLALRVTATITDASGQRASAVRLVPVKRIPARIPVAG